MFVVGHGRSEGEPVYVDDIQVYVRDVRQHITEVTVDYPDVPLFIVGYSMVSAMKFFRPPKHLNEKYTRLETKARKSLSLNKFCMY